VVRILRLGRWSGGSQRIQLHNDESATSKPGEAGVLDVVGVATCLVFTYAGQELPEAGKGKVDQAHSAVFHSVLNCHHESSGFLFFLDLNV